MEIRKQKEKEWADERFKDVADLDVVEYQKKHSNKKFYSITRASKDYIDQITERAAKDKICLDYCCGAGSNTLKLSRQAKKAYGIDISSEGVRLAKLNAEKMGLTDKVEYLVADAEHTDFPDNSFDFISCLGVLHHLDITSAYKELARILKPDGLILCVEPLKYNPVFQIYRRMTPHLRTEWERDHILGLKDLQLAHKYFGHVELRFFHLITLAAVAFRRTPLFNGFLGLFEAADNLLLKVPFVQNLSWQVVFQLKLPNK